MVNKIFISLIVPVYNEETRIEKGIKNILDYLDSQNFSWELLIVDDGSTDSTFLKAKNLLKNKKNLRLIQSEHSGKGGAIKRGVEKAEGDWVLFFDIDLATPMGELNKFLKYKDKYNIIIGSRKMKGANIIMHQPFFREFGGKIFTLLTNLIVTKNITDVTCGFKLYQAKVAKELFAQSILADWSFDAELLYLAQKKGLKIKELPVEWRDDPHTKVNLPKDTITAFLGLIKIRLNDLQGKY